jgi:hypothetical protein
LRAVIVAARRDEGFVAGARKSACELPTSVRRGGSMGWVSGNGRRVGDAGKRRRNGGEENAPKGKPHERCPGTTSPGWIDPGASRREGRQTLRAEGGGQAKPANSRTGSVDRVEGERSLRESSPFQKEGG